MCFYFHIYLATITYTLIRFLCICKYVDTVCFLVIFSREMYYYLFLFLTCNLIKSYLLVLVFYYY